MKRSTARWYGVVWRAQLDIGHLASKSYEAGRALLHDAGILQPGVHSRIGGQPKENIVLSRQPPPSRPKGLTRQPGSAPAQDQGSPVHYAPHPRSRHPSRNGSSPSPSGASHTRCAGGDAAGSHSVAVGAGPAPALVRTIPLDVCLASTTASIRVCAACGGSARLRFVIAVVYARLSTQCIVVDVYRASSSEIAFWVLWECDRVASSCRWFEG